MRLRENPKIAVEVKILEECGLFEQKDLEFAISWLTLMVCNDLVERVGLSLSKTAELLDIGQETVKKWIADNDLEWHYMFCKDWRVIPVDTVMALKRIKIEKGKK